MSNQPEDVEPEDMDVADQVAYEDTGRPWGARVIRHPSHAATRRHLAANPLPAQQNRRTS
ncbi:hypothetical protein [Streptomyces asoensis]|uniref:MbtH-like domain-containing protein n=1 Tax=Streptomyces asoensis TaxID=249586 RepID=A0ABQ3RYU1_9ACTN|nr:hypothetical protein [Streptomyces asoensis]GGQ48552.1 hypothetical protein GCM10010496_08470 [Streptomyces asoensis]GHI61039.1 hypothetical protein Saso_26890 [Streptomyces asoensis]